MRLAFHLLSTRGCRCYGGVGTGCSECTTGSLACVLETVSGFLSGIEACLVSLTALGYAYGPWGHSPVFTLARTCKHLQLLCGKAAGVPAYLLGSTAGLNLVRAFVALKPHTLGNPRFLWAWDQRYFLKVLRRRREEASRKILAFRAIDLTVLEAFIGRSLLLILRQVARIFQFQTRLSWIDGEVTKQESSPHLQVSSPQEV